MLKKLEEKVDKVDEKIDSNRELESIKNNKFQYLK